MMARWAFRALIRRAVARSDSRADVDVLRQAEALDGLHFDLLPPSQVRAVAAAVRAAADDLAPEMAGGAEARDREFAALLTDLSVALSSLEK